MPTVFDSHVYLQEAESLLKFGTFDWQTGQETILWSEGLYKVFGFTEPFPSVTVEWYMQHVHEDDRTRLQEEFRRMLVSPEPIEVQYRARSFTGEELVLISRARRVDEDDRIRLVGISADITANTRFQHELKDKVSALDRSNHELEQFAYIASHDLQEPLRKITSFGERLQARHHASLGEEGRHYLSRMLDATQRMKLLIESLLSYSRLSRPEEPFVPVDLNVVITNVLSDFELRLSETNARVETGKLPVVSGLATQLHQLFQNLISNALKFMPTSQQPQITIESRVATRQEVGEYRLPLGQKFYTISVTDNGIGFEEAYSEQIFTLFRRLHGRSEYEGAGMGLAICKRIVENHGGVIFARSQHHQGTSFVLLLPEQQKNEMR